MSFPTELIGNDLSKYGERKWEYGVLASDGCIYAAPFCAKQILKIDPTNDTTELVGREFHDQRDKYIGGAELKKDWIYFAPASANQVMKFNIRTKEVELIGESYFNENQWASGAVGKDGCMYCAPHMARQILRIDPSDDTTSLVGKELELGGLKYYAAIASKDKKLIYFLPANSDNILIYNVDTEESTTVGIGHLQFGGQRGHFYNHKWYGASLATDGCIYAVPSTARKILKYDISAKNNIKSTEGYDPFEKENPMLVGDSFGNAGWKWYGCVSKDEYIYGIPYGANKVLRYNTNSGECTHVGNYYPGQKKWFGGVLAENGCIYAIPWYHNKVLKINPDLISNNTRPTTKYHTSVGLVDSPKGGDKLEHQLYAKALVHHIVNMEGNDKALSVGLFGPWGSGKTFFWELIQEEFKNLPEYKAKDDPEKNSACLRIEEDSSYIAIAAFMVWEWIRKTFDSLFRAFFCCYFTGKWESPNSDDVTYIDMTFNTWTYNRSKDIWASMLDTMWKKVEEELEGKKGFDIKWHRAGIERSGTKESDSKEIRLKKEKIARKKLEVKLNVSITLFVWSVTLLIVMAAFFLKSKNTADYENETNLSNHIYLLVISAVATFGSVSNLVIRLLNFWKDIKFGFAKINKEIDSYERRDFAKDFGIMGIVEKEVKHLFAFLRAHKARIRLFVDDLDRLDQQKAMDVLWVVSLLFGTSDAPITSFLAVDTKIIVDYIVEEFKNINGFRYLEKIINLPFSIPDIEPKEKEQFLEQLVDKLQITQIYHKALEHSQKGRFPCIFGDIKNDVLKKGDEKEMLDGLIEMGKKMNNRVGNLNKIDKGVLDKAKESRRIEELLLALQTNFDILENKRHYPPMPPLAAPNAHQAPNPPHSQGALYNSIAVQEERLFIKKYSHCIDGVPRKMIRILNVYNVSRSYAFLKGDMEEIHKPDFLEHLFVFTILQELCPYRTSWLLYISRCAAELQWEETGESESFFGLLRRLAEDEDCDVLDLRVATVYTRIVCEVLHCLSVANQELTADVGVMHFAGLLGSLTLLDFETLRKYAFNLPRSMISDIKMYRNDCTISVKEFPDDEENKKRGREYKWVATFHKIKPANDRKEMEGPSPAYESLRQSLLHDLTTLITELKSEVTPLQSQKTQKEG